MVDLTHPKNNLLLHNNEENHHMKYHRWLPIFILFITANAHAFQSKVEIQEQFDNLKMVAFIDEKDINNNPEWNPNVGAPPLSVIDAIQSVKDFNKTSKNLGTIKEIEIRPVSKRGNHWHYLIKIANNSMKTKYDVYVVLMNGKVIPAIIVPQSYK